MSYKRFTQAIVLITLLLASFAVPISAHAWSNCGGTYVVQWGDTMGGIAAYCGTTVAALYAANPGISGYLYAGQVLYMPGGGNVCNCPQTGYANTYVVQYGDYFSAIAQRFGVSTYALWSANPQIWNINLIYPGQVLYVPGSSGVQVVPASTEPLVERSYGAVAPGTPTGTVKLVNIANAQVYVSFQGTTNDGANVIHEYPVDGVMKEKIPAAWYTYVAWVGGVEYSGQFKLAGGSSHTITFYPNRVAVD
jgi:LysM repeat protein